MNAPDAHDVLPPLMLSIVASDQRTRTMVVDFGDQSEGEAERLSGWIADWPKGDVYCSVKAPNGATNHGYLRCGGAGHFSGDKLHEQVRALLAETFPLTELWIDADSGILDPVTSEDQPSLLAWSDATTPLSSPSLEIARRSGSVAEYRVYAPEREPRFLQVWTEPGPSVVTHIAAGTTFTPALAQRAEGVWLLGLPEHNLAAAYWGFARHCENDAAHALGARLADRVSQFTPETRPSRDDMLAAAHHGVRRGLDQKRADFVRKELGDDPSTDAAIARWALASADPDVDPVTLQEAFVSILTRMVSDPPTLTPIFRLLYERFPVALNMCDAATREGLIKAYGSHIRKLSTATYWDAPYLTYRAVSPGVPDAEALGRHVGAGLKKKASNSIFQAPEPEGPVAAP